MLVSPVAIVAIVATQQLQSYDNLSGRVLRHLARHVLEKYAFETVGRPIQSGVLTWLAREYPGLGSRDEINEYADAFGRMFEYVRRERERATPLSTVEV